MKTPFLILSIALVAASFSTHAESPVRQPATVFDDWAPGEKTDGVTRNFASWKSPSGKFSITYLTAKQDPDDFILVGENTADGSHTVLGYGTRGADVKWFKTKMGDLAVVDYNSDAGLNELFVLKPSTGKKDAWALLYRTPSLGLGAGYCVEQCYWTLVKLDPDLGTMKLKASWCYSDATNAQRKTMKTEGVYDVPLFYGYK